MGKVWGQGGSGGRRSGGRQGPESVLSLAAMRLQDSGPRPRLVEMAREGPERRVIKVYVSSFPSLSLLPRLGFVHWHQHPPGPFPWLKPTSRSAGAFLPFNHSPPLSPCTHSPQPPSSSYHSPAEATACRWLPSCLPLPFSSLGLFPTHSQREVTPPPKIPWWLPTAYNKTQTPDWWAPAHLAHPISHLQPALLP